MTRFRVFVLLFTFAITGALMYGKPLWWSLAGALFALMALAILWSWLGVNWIRVGRRALTKVGQVGQTLEEEFRITNLSRMPKLWTEIRDMSDLPGHQASRVLGLIPPLQWRGWRASTLCMDRGRFHLGPIKVRSGDPLGIFQMQRTIEIVNPLLVYPITFDFHSFPLPIGFLPGGDAQRRRTHYITTNASGARDYVTGDSINRIHWGLSAKRQRLIVKEFELDPMSDLWIAIDLHDAVRVAQPNGGLLIGENHLPPDTFEYVVSIAASVAKHFLRQNQAVGLIAHGLHRDMLPTDRGERQLAKLMEIFAVVRAQGLLPFGTVLDKELSQIARGSTVIAISASPDVAWAVAVQRAMRSGLRVVALVVDGASFGAETTSQDIIAALAETGAIVRIIRYGDSIPEAVQRLGA